MKKILKFAVAGLMLAAMSTTAFATIEFEDPDDAIGNLVMPGQTYTFPLMRDGAYLDRYYYEDFKTSIKIVEGRTYVDTCEIFRQADGTYALRFKAKTNFSYTQPDAQYKQVKIRITETEKIDRKVDVPHKEDTDLDLEIGYPYSDYVSSDSYDVSNDNPVVEFYEDLDRCTLSFGYAAEYDAKFSKKTKFNLGFSEQSNKAVTSKNPDASMTFISFTAKPRFDVISEFRIDDSNARYVYEITDKGLVNLNGTRKNGKIAFKTDQLTAYVASDIALNNVKPSSSSTPTTPSNPPKADPPTGGGTALTTNTVLTTVNNALATVGGGQVAYPTFQNAQSISMDALKAANTAAVNAGKKLLINFDSVKDKKVVGRYYIDPSKAANLSGSIKLGIATDNASVRATFNKFYSNYFAIASFDQKTSFGMPVSVAVKLDLSQLNTKTLKFYAYDAVQNRYDQFTPAYSIDNLGYLYFDTTYGGDIVITDRPLALR